MKQAKKKVVLHAGDYFFGKAGTHIHTLLGSCISITLWHPTLQIGGMCHFALPRPNNVAEEDRLNPRYAEDCIELFKHSVIRKHTLITEYQVKIFGGGNMGPKNTSTVLDEDERLNIGDTNAVIAYKLLKAEKVDVLVAHVGEFGHRRIVFDISTGDVWVRFTPNTDIAHNMGSQNLRV